MSAPIARSGWKRSPATRRRSAAVSRARPRKLSTWFENRLSGSEIFGALSDAELLGIAGFLIQQGPKRAHKATLWGMYVRPQARGRGVARRLAEAVIDAARKQAELIQLCVVSDNLAAMRLYSGLGFVEYGLEKNALKQGGRYYDEVLMALPLAPIPR